MILPGRSALLSYPAQKPAMPITAPKSEVRSPSGRRLKAVIGHPFLRRGGSEARVMWLIEALKSKYEITVVTTGGWDLAGLNAYYGTRVKEDEVRSEEQ